LSTWQNNKITEKIPELLDFSGFSGIMFFGGEGEIRIIVLSLICKAL
jgi:hypothetical protein